MVWLGIWQQVVAWKLLASSHTSKAQRNLLSAGVRDIGTLTSKAFGAMLQRTRPQVSEMCNLLRQTTVVDEYVRRQEITTASNDYLPSRL